MSHLSLYFPYTLALIVSMWALWRGGQTERAAAALTMTFWYVTPLLSWGTHRLPYPGGAAVDVIATVTFGLWSMRTRDLWMLCMAAFELDTVACHVMKAIFPGISLYAYLTAIYIWGTYAQVACLLAGMLSLEGRLRAATRPVA